MNKFGISVFRFSLLVVLMSGCVPATTPLPPTNIPPTSIPATTVAVGGITTVAVKIAQEQGSGAVCSADTTYFVSLDITSNGATSASYEISATDGSGQVADGLFDQFGSPFVADSIVFAGAGTQTVWLRLTGPYSYPDTITIRARVNGGEFQQTQVQCQ